MNFNPFAKPEGEKTMSKVTTVTKQTLNEIWMHIEADPLAGLGGIGEKDLFIDKIIAHIRIAEGGKQARPILSDVVPSLDPKAAGK